MSTNKPISSLSEIRQYLAENNRAMYFISPTNFNLLGIDEWVKHFKFINYIDCFDGHHPNVVLPKSKSAIVFESMEDINNYLLENKDILDQFKADQARLKTDQTPLAFFLFFDDNTENIVDEAGMVLGFPKLSLIKDIDNKITTTEIGNAAGVPSVPNALEPVKSYEDLRQIADSHNLGDKLVVQTAYGDSGKTTFFISEEEDYKKVAEEIEAEERVKVMKQIRCRGTAIEACVTASGTVVGPLLTELIGVESLTPYKGGWCGNELYQGAFSDDVLKDAQDKVVRIGAELQKRGYKGYFEVDFLIDLDDDSLYLGELNPRITGISAMTNLSEFAASTLPPFLFHIMEFSGIPYSFDVEDYNAHSLKNGASQTWGQLIFKYTQDDLKIVTKAPQSGLWEMDDNGDLHFVGPQLQRRTAQHDNQAFFLRISKEDDYFYKGADKGILFVRQQLMEKDGQLTAEAKRWIDGLNAQYELRDLTREEQLLVARYQNPGQLKTF